MQTSSVWLESRNTSKHVNEYYESWNVSSSDFASELKILTGQLYVDCELKTNFLEKEERRATCPLQHEGLKILIHTKIIGTSKMSLSNDIKNRN